MKKIKCSLKKGSMINILLLDFLIECGYLFLVSVFALTPVILQSHRFVPVNHSHLSCLYTRPYRNIKIILINTNFPSIYFIEKYESPYMDVQNISIDARLH